MTLPITDGLVAAYDFVQGDDPTILYDISGNRHHGTIIGGATWTDYGLHLDGVTGYVNVGDIGNLGPDYTIIAVAKADKDAHMDIISRATSDWKVTAEERGFFLRKEDTADFWRVYHYDGNGETNYRVVAREIAPTADWQLLTARGDTSTLELVAGIRTSSPVNTYSDKSIKPTTGMLDHTGDYYIGRAAHTSAFYFEGTIGYIAVYNRKLTDAETLSVQTAIHNEIAARGIPITRNVRPMIAITIDDAFETDYTNAYRLASARGIPLTSYINTNNVGRPGHLTWNQIHEMRAAGFGVEDHGYTHTHITTLSEAELRASMEAVDAAFIAAGLSIPEHYAFPGGQSDATRRAIIADYRDTGRNIVRDTIPAISGWGQTVDWQNVNAQHSMTEKQGDSIDHIKAKIDHAIQHNHVLIIFTHDISDNPTDSGCYVGNFEELLDYVAAKRDAGLIDPVTIDGLYRAMQGIRTRPATGSKTLHGEVTGATYDKTVDYVGFVWGTTRHNNPEGTAPDASGYDQYWISPVGDYAESKFAHTPELLAGTYYYRAAAKVDGVWVYGEELTLTVAPSSDLPALYPAKLGSPYTVLAAPFTTGDVLMTVHDADKLETPPNVVCLSGSVAGEFSYTGRYGNTLTGVTALPGTPQATWGVGTFAFRGIAAYDLNSLIETVERLKAQIAALQTPGE